MILAATTTRRARGVKLGLVAVVALAAAGVVAAVVPSSETDIWKGVVVAPELPIHSPPRPAWNARLNAALKWRQPDCRFAYYSREQPDCLARELDRDHLMPQAELLRSGLGRDAYRSAYLDARNIWVLPSAENRAKSDSVLSARWQPPAEVACRFATDWLTMKKRWKLSVDEVERDQLAGLLATC